MLGQVPIHDLTTCARYLRGYITFQTPVRNKHVNYTVLKCALKTLNENVRD
jgi:hypothetical protein